MPAVLYPSPDRLCIWRFDIRSDKGGGVYIKIIEAGDKFSAVDIVLLCYHIELAFYVHFYYLAFLLFWQKMSADSDNYSIAPTACQPHYW